MDKEIKKVDVKVKVEDDGHIVLKTKEKELPTKVVQEIIDEIVGAVIFMSNKKQEKELPINKIELLIWQVFAITEMLAILILVLKIKGVV